MKSCDKTAIQLGVVLLSLAVTANGISIEKVNKRQVGGDKGIVLDTTEDRAAEATGFHGAGAVQAHAKYFQYAHVPQKDHYEVGHRKGNDHHFTERHEKAHPHSGVFKTKVRWGDKHGGYGEHYWDYNHAGHGGDSHDEGSEQISDYRGYEDQQNRKKRQPGMTLILDEATGRVVDQISGRSYLLQPLS